MDVEMTDASPLQYAELYNKQIVDIFDWSREHRLVDACDLSTVFDTSKQVKVLSSQDKKSASETVIILGDFRVPLVLEDQQGNTRIAIKLSFEPLDPKRDNSLEVERKAYRQVTNPLVLNGHTPNVMLYVGSVECKEFIARGNAPEAGLEILTREVQRIEHTQRYNIDHIWLLILEQGEGMPLNRFTRTFKKMLTWDNFWQPVLFQLMYTLLCFQQVGFAQNDLHAGNVWIDVLDAPLEFVYQADETHAWAFTTLFVVKMFDYDRTAKSPTRYNRTSWINTRLDSEGICDSTGQCNGFTVFFDAFNILYNIYHFERFITSDVRKVGTWIQRFIDREALNKRYAWGGQPCVCVQPSPIGCKKCQLVEPHDKTLLDQIVLEGFHSYQVTPGTDEWTDHITENSYVWRLPSLQF